jgi:O-antigen/teichoic acid export membrane protein
MTQPSFLKNISLRFLLTIPLRFRGLIVLPLLTRLYSQDIYGAWLQVLLISEVLSNLLSLQLGAALVRYLSGEKDPKRAIKAVFTITVGCSLCFIGLVWIFGPLASRLIFGSAGLQSILRIASFWISIQALMRVGLSVLRSQERIGTLSIRELLSALWMICAVFVSYLMKLELAELILICLSGDALLLAWILIQIGVPSPFLSLPECVAVTRRYLIFSAPLIFGSLFLWFTRSIDRFLIVQLLGLSSVGVYGVTFQVASLLFFVLRPINYVLFPRVAKAWNQEEKDEVNRYFSQAVVLTLILGFPLMVGIFMTSDGLITLLAGRSYWGGKALMLVLLLAGLASMVYQNHLYVIQLVEKTYLLPFLFISTAALNTVLGYFLIPKTGLVGAAAARALTLILMATVVTVWARRHVKFTISWTLVLRVGLASLIMGLALHWIPMDSWENLAVKVVTGSAVFVLFLFLLRVVSKKNLVILKNQL